MYPKLQYGYYTFFNQPLFYLKIKTILFLTYINCYLFFYEEKCVFS